MMTNGHVIYRHPDGLTYSRHVVLFLGHSGTPSFNFNIFYLHSTGRVYQCQHHVQLFPLTTMSRESHSEVLRFIIYIYTGDRCQRLHVTLFPPLILASPFDDMYRLVEMI